MLTCMQLNIQCTYLLAELFEEENYYPCCKLMKSNQIYSKKRHLTSFVSVCSFSAC